MERTPHTVDVQAGGTSQKLSVLLKPYYEDKDIASLTGIAPIKEGEAPVLSGGLDASKAVSDGMLVKVTCSVKYTVGSDTKYCTRAIYASASKLPGLCNALVTKKIPNVKGSATGTITSARIRRRRIFR